MGPRTYLLVGLFVSAFAACKDGTPPVAPNDRTATDADAGTPTAANATADAGSSANASATVLKFEDSGKAITLKVGAPLVVKLRANGGTGFEWEVSKNDPSILPPDGEPKGERLDDAQVGGKVMMSYAFVAKAAGTTHLEIILHRSWEKKAPLQTFALDVTVK